MRSTNLIVNDLDIVRKHLLENIKKYVQNTNQQKRLNELCGYISAICFFSGSENAIKIVESNLFNVKKSLDGLSTEPPIKYSKDALNTNSPIKYSKTTNELINVLTDLISEYEKSFKDYQDDKLESLDEQIDEINAQFSEFKYSKTSSSVLFKKDHSKANGSHQNGVTTTSVTSSPPIIKGN